MDTIAILVRSIFQKQSLSECSIEELHSAARQYSYFTPVQLLFAEKLRGLDKDRYKEQLQTLSLHFNNGLWLDFLLNGYTDGIIVEDGAELSETSVLSDRDQDQSPETSEKVLLTESPQLSEPEKPGDEASQEEPDIFEEEALTEEVEKQKEILVEELTNYPEMESTESPYEKANGEVDENVHALTGTAMQEKEHIELPEDSQVELGTGLNEEIIQMDSVDTTREDLTETPQVQNMDVENQEMQSQQNSQDDIPMHSDATTEQELPDTPLTGVTQESNSGMAFEPYHTVDYFASQGIKFIPEEKPSDRFGQQLKSFTEWLKIMKRLPQTEIVRFSDPSSEEKVQHLASTSIDEGEVVTEAMAEVWLKQGNKEKAIEIYNKLSLLNPAKSHYFATTIEQLKNS